jgi:hypothetical protein
MLLTRIGMNSRLVITGDLEQSDKLENNGLKDLVNKLKNTNLALKNIMLVELNGTDIQRSDLVSQVVKLYNSNPLHTPSIPSTPSTPILLSPYTSKKLSIIIPKSFKTTNTSNSNSSNNNDAALIPLNHITKSLK